MTYKEQQALCISLDALEARIATWRQEDGGEETEGVIELLCDAEGELRRTRLKLMTEWAVAIPVRPRPEEPQAPLKKGA